MTPVILVCVGGMLCRAWVIAHSTHGIKPETSCYQTCWKWRHQTVEISFDAQSATLICHLEGEADEPKRLQIQGLSKANLMGEISEFQRLPEFQLSLPWSPEEWRAIAYAEMSAA